MKKVKTSAKQRAAWRRWAEAHPEENQQRKNEWAKSPAGKKWLRKNQVKKNKRRDAWRKRKNLESKKRVAQRSNTQAHRGREEKP